LIISIYFEKSQIRNVPKPTDIEKYYQEKSQLEMPDLKNVPKIELELKSPPLGVHLNAGTSNVFASGLLGCSLLWGRGVLFNI
jgi:hypothetical protein